MDEIGSGTTQVDCDVLVIGGGTAGPMAAVKAKEADPKAARGPAGEGQRQAQRRHRMGMDGLNNAVDPRPRDARSST